MISGICLFLRKDLSLVDSYDCIHFRYGCPTSPYTGATNYRCKYLHIILCMSTFYSSMIDWLDKGLHLIGNISDMYCLTREFFYSYHCRWRAKIFYLCPALVAIEQRGFFGVPYLLWHWAFVYNGYLREPVKLTPITERWVVEMSLPVFTT